tara:strand:- start:879 stop:1391 length:513 start_codon:yes stop_codon:yes gene_type:complete
MGTKRVGWARIKSLINENQNQLKILKPQIIAVSGTRLLAASESGATVVWTLGTNHHITLPSATVGLKYTFIIQKASNDAHTIVTQTADKIYGMATLTRAGFAADKTSAQSVEKAGAAGIDAVHFDANVNAKGGGAGDKVELVCVEAGYWICTAHLTLVGADPNATLTILD